MTAKKTATKKTAAKKTTAKKVNTPAETEGTRVPSTASEQEAAESRKLSELEQERDEHNRRVAPGGAQLPPPLKGTNPPRPS